MGQNQRLNLDSTLTFLNCRPVLHHILSKSTLNSITYESISVKASVRTDRGQMRATIRDFCGRSTTIPYPCCTTVDTLLLSHSSYAYEFSSILNSFECDKYDGTNFGRLPRICPPFFICSDRARQGASLGLNAYA